MPETMDSIRINERAWTLILDRMQKMMEDGVSQATIARQIGCDRATVNRWILNRRGGYRTTFKDMVRVLDRLRIPLKDVFGVDEELLSPSPDFLPTGFDQAVSEVIHNVAKAVGKNVVDIARDLEGLEPSDVKMMLKGKAPMRVSDFHGICRVVGVSPSVVLDRASGLSESE
jgi:transcriptional regulator with XRE-family HTH domain